MIPDPTYNLEKIEYNHDGSVSSRTIHEFSTISLDEVLRQMTYFLRGCSFVIPEMDTLTLRREGEQ